MGVAGGDSSDLAAAGKNIIRNATQGTFWPVFATYKWVQGWVRARAVAVWPLYGGHRMPQLRSQYVNDRE